MWPFMQREKPAFKELSSTKCTMRSIRSVMEKSDSVRLKNATIPPPCGNAEQPVRMFSR